ncbi:MAG TPA: S8 family serine peptidase, partial [Euzebya sp.]|nr:S8 family serine peptidase [Euzebya sp.]
MAAMPVAMVQASPATVPVAQVNAPDDVVQPWLAQQLAAASATEMLHVMVHAAGASSIGDAVAAVQASGMALQDTWPRIGVAVAVGTPAQIQGVALQPGVVYVEGNQPLDYHMDTSHTATRGDLARASFTDVDGNPIDGTGVSIAIVDSGVDGDHPMFRLPDGTSKVRRNLEVNPACNFLVPQEGGLTNTACLVDSLTNKTDTGRAGGHGTHVAGTAAGLDVTTTDGRQLHGAAPGATLISISTGGAIAVLGANHGLNWILENHANPCAGNLTQPAVQECAPIRSTNHSYGPIGGGAFDPNSATTRLQDALAAEGVVTNWAAGNDGGDGSQDRVSPQAKNPTPGVIGVASFDDGDSGTRDGSTSSFSSRGRDGDVSTYPDISAPGSNITSACGPTLPICQSFEADLDYGTISGTSMATPHIAGIVAQLLQADPTLTPAQVEDVLEDTAYQFAGGADYEADLDARNDDHTTSFDKGHGLVDAAAAVAAILGLAVPDAPEVAGCVPGEPQVTDPAGDANAVLGAPVLPVNQPALDILSAQLTADPDTNDVTFTITVADLPDSPGGTSGEGEHFD